MALYGFDFRADAGPPPTDPANHTYDLGAQYSVSRGGFTFGWTTDTTGTARTRDDGADARLAGSNGPPNDGSSTATWRLDLPSAGTYSIRLAVGDITYEQLTTLVLKDNTTTKLTLSAVSTAAGSFADATGTVYTAANWPGSNTGVEVTFASTTLNVVLGPYSGDYSSVIAHLSIEEVGGAATGSGALASPTPSLSAVGTLYAYQTYGYATPDAGEIAQSWTTWNLGSGATISGDANYGELVVPSTVTCNGPVVDMGSVANRQITFSTKYGTNTGSHTKYIRGSATAFLWNDGTPSWAEYTGAVTQEWRYVQARIVGV